MPYLLRPLTMLLFAALAMTCLPAAAERASAGAREARTVPHVPAGTTAGYMVFDRTTRATTLAHNIHGRFRSASVVKILIALDHLQSRRPGQAIPAADQRLLRDMLRSSDDDAASELWRRGGRRAIIDRMVRRLGLRDTEAPPASRPGFWGYTALSASDVVLTYRYLLDRADPKIRDLILGHLRHATRCASDDFDQYFGIPRAVPRPWAVKQGWSGYGATPAVRCSGARSTASATASGDALPPIASGDALPATASGSASPVAAPGNAVPDAASGAASVAASTAAGATAAAPARPPVNLLRPVLHTTGLVGAGDRLIIVVLTLQPAGASYSGSAARLTTLARQVYLAGRPR
ncbi:hypothetical protein ABZT47_33575 [Sphaerisporangium sp. NPDC005289]|uniref:hypothetical protein n=1 Tax=Sphaerisporangium sp. NPDC005289 TaxID=3155247 RepID=UPI0033B4D76B